jgi:hypothetical protein
VCQADEMVYAATDGFPSASSRCWPPSRAATDPDQLAFF